MCPVALTELRVHGQANHSLPELEQTLNEHLRMLSLGTSAHGAASGGPSPGISTAALVTQLVPVEARAAIAQAQATATAVRTEASSRSAATASGETCPAMFTH